MTARSPVRLRHWKQRFKPTARFVFRRATNWDGTSYSPGDRVPDGITERRLRMLWDARRIQLMDFPPIDVATGGKAIVPASGTSHRPRSKRKLLEAIVAAIGQLDPSNTKHWTGAGLPRVELLETILGYDISAAERNEAWAEYQRQHEAG